MKQRQTELSRMKTFFHFPWCKSFPLTFLLFVISYHWWGWTTEAINWSGYQIKLNHLLNWVPIWSRLDHKTSTPNKRNVFWFYSESNPMQCPTKYKVRYIYNLHYLNFQISNVGNPCSINHLYYHANDTVISRNILWIKSWRS